MSAIEIFGFETSNNMKVRIALEYKDLDYTFTPIDPRETANEIVGVDRAAADSR